jgi:predicted unusual protein kinase regulating ubiquinone biosynthesis (AarF/ABC1/UbiB family)
MKSTHLSTKTQKAFRLTKVATNVGIQKYIYKQNDKTIGNILCNELKTLGPTFVKIGQFISTRSDIFGTEFTNELKELQDKALPMTPEDIQFLKQPLQDQLDMISDEPIAAASIGQVHYGKLKDGRPVAIKFKRRNIEETIKSDFSMLLAVIKVVKAFVSERQIMELEVSLTQYYELLIEEINYKKEIENMKLFAKQFKKTKWVKVPVPYEKYCTNDVIVMEYVPSIKINDLQQIKQLDLNNEIIAEKLIECFFIQVVNNGFVHIDPHPGNVGVMEEGKIVFYDYGMFVKLDGIMKDNLKKLFLAMYDRDIDAVCELLITLDIVIVEPAKKPYFKKFIASFLTYIDNLNVNDFRLSYIDKIDLDETQFLISSKYLLLLRGIAILEGVCKTLNPNFNYRDVLDPFISEFTFDLQYLERRGTRDLERFTKTPDKVLTSEISLGMVETDMDKMKKQIVATNKNFKLMSYAFILTLMFQAETMEVKLVLASALLYLSIKKI